VPVATRVRVSTSAARAAIGRPADTFSVPSLLMVGRRGYDLIGAAAAAARAGVSLPAGVTMLPRS